MEVEKFFLSVSGFNKFSTFCTTHIQTGGMEGVFFGILDFFSASIKKRIFSVSFSGVPERRGSSQEKQNWYSHDGVDS